MPEGFVPQDQHDAAMAALRAELSEAINVKQAEINALKTQVAETMQQSEKEIIALQAERDQLKNEVSVSAKDNASLRKGLADYLMSTDGGQAALRAFNIMLLKNQAEAIQKKLTELQE